MSTAIQIENLGKMYRLGLTHAGSIRELVDRWTRRVLRRPLDEDQVDEKEFWALRNFNAEIKEGEVVGVIGKNGAGKSTLLKILSRVTKPTTGRATIAGRVGSLLEVGTGFHPELTGRENIFLNGTILGMSRREISRKLDEIIDFAEIERFIETPVKRYSSGMYVRLAFAVAAHLEPEVLIVDEVLAVGDTAFQKKCLGKMESVGQGGRTILFVSHNMGAVKQLCQRAILLQNGTVIADGKASEVVDEYLARSAPVGQDGLISEMHPRVGTGEARVLRVHLLNEDRQPTDWLFYRQPLKVRFQLDVTTTVPSAYFDIGVWTRDGDEICVAFSEWCHGPQRLTSGNFEVEAELPVNLSPGNYFLGVNIMHERGHSIDYLNKTVEFEVGSTARSADNHYRFSEIRGFLQLPATWQVSGCSRAT